MSSLTQTPLALQGLVAVFFTCYEGNEFLFMKDVIDDPQRRMQRHEPSGSELSFRQPTGVSVIMYIHGTTTHSGPGPPHCKGFTITLKHNTLGGTPLYR